MDKESTKSLSIFAERSTFVRLVCRLTPNRLSIVCSHGAEAPTTGWAPVSHASPSGTASAVSRWSNLAASALVVMPIRRSDWPRPLTGRCRWVTQWEQARGR